MDGAPRSHGCTEDIKYDESVMESDRRVLLPAYALISGTGTKLLTGYSLRFDSFFAGWSK